MQYDICHCANLMYLLALLWWDQTWCRNLWGFKVYLSLVSLIMPSIDGLPGVIFEIESSDEKLTAAPQTELFKGLCPRSSCWGFVTSSRVRPLLGMRWNVWGVSQGNRTCETSKWSQTTAPLKGSWKVIGRHFLWGASRQTRWALVLFAACRPVSRSALLVLHFWLAVFALEEHWSWMGQPGICTIKGVSE